MYLIKRVYQQGKIDVYSVDTFHIPYRSSSVYKEYT